MLFQATLAIHQRLGALTPLKLNAEENRKACIRVLGDIRIFGTLSALEVDGWCKIDYALCS